MRTATFDDFLPALTRANASLPVLTSEVGDTWIHGMQSDPFKTKAMRAMMRARSGCVADGSCDAAAPGMQNFTRLLMKNGGETDGQTAPVHTLHTILPQPCIPPPPPILFFYF